MFRLFLAAFISYFFLLFTYGAEPAKTAVSSAVKNIKSSDAKTFITNAGLINTLNGNFENAAKAFNADFQDDAKTMSAAKRKQLEDNLNLFKSRKEKIIAEIVDKIEKDLNIRFTPAELKYLADQSGTTLFKKLDQFFLSAELKRYFNEPFRQAISMTDLNIKK